MKVVFFVITQDLKLGRYAELLKELYFNGHEIASHSHTHPYFKGNVSRAHIEEEVGRSYEEIKVFFGAPPTGYRSPGFFLNDQMLQSLIDAGYKYDSSLFYSPFIGLLDLGAKLRGVSTGHRRQRPIDWDNLKSKTFKEFPLPSCLGLPFYHNLNLYFPRPFKDLMLYLGSRSGYSPYLFHIIEFADPEEDGCLLPSSVLKHPNVQTPLKQKIHFAKAMLRGLKKGRVNMLTKDCI